MSENGLVTIQVQNMIFWVAQPGVPVYRPQGTMSDWSAGGWHCIGLAGPGRGGSQGCRPGHVAISSSDEVLLQAPEDVNYPQI